MRLSQRSLDVHLSFIIGTQHFILIVELAIGVKDELSLRLRQSRHFTEAGQLEDLNPIRLLVILHGRLLSSHTDFVERTQHVHLVMHMLAEVEAEPLTNPQLQHVVIHCLLLLAQNV